MWLWVSKIFGQIRIIFLMIILIVTAPFEVSKLRDYLLRELDTVLTRWFEEKTFFELERRCARILFSILLFIFILLVYIFSFTYLFFFCFFGYWSSFFFVFAIEYFTLREYSFVNSFWFKKLIAFRNFWETMFDTNGIFHENFKILFDLYMRHINIPLSIFIKVDCGFIRIFVYSFLSAVTIFCIFFFVPSFIGIGLDPLY